MTESDKSAAEDLFRDLAECHRASVAIIKAPMDEVIAYTHNDPSGLARDLDVLGTAHDAAETLMGINAAAERKLLAAAAARRAERG
jgi:hypothetical protein